MHWTPNLPVSASPAEPAAATAAAIATFCSHSSSSGSGRCLQRAILLRLDGPQSKVQQQLTFQQPLALRVAASATGEACLALPKLNLQFLTFHDYLLRNFNLFRLEATYEVLTSSPAAHLSSISNNTVSHIAIGPHSQAQELPVHQSMRLRAMLIGCSVHIPVACSANAQMRDTSQASGPPFRLGSCTSGPPMTPFVESMPQTIGHS